MVVSKQQLSSIIAYHCIFRLSSLKATGGTILRAHYQAVRAIDNFVYMMTSSKWRPGTILENLYAPQNFDPVFLSTVVWSLESQFPWKRTNRASIQSNQQWRPWQCVEEFCIRSRTAAPKLRSEWLTCYEAKGNLR